MEARNLYALNNSLNDPNIRGAIPDVVIEEHLDVSVGAMVAGIKTVDVTSAFGTGKGVLLGVIALEDKATADNHALALSVAASGTAGKVTVTVHSTDSSDTTNYTLSFLLLGRPLPVAAS